MANLNDVIKLTAEQYNTLINGGTISGHNYDENSIYLIEDSDKSIYTHNVTLYKENGTTSTSEKKALIVQLMSNSPTPFTSISQMLTYIRGWGMTTARVPVSGAYYPGNFGAVTVIATMWEVTQSTETLFGIGTDGSMHNSSSNVIRLSDTNWGSIEDCVVQLQ